MITLVNPPLSTLLSQLFSDADATQAKFHQEIGQLTIEQRKKLMENIDPIELYSKAEDIHLAISRETGILLYMLARSCKAKSIIEFGTSFGVSTLHLAAALKDNGGGKLIGSEFLHSKVVKARHNIELGGLTDFVEIREGDAIQTLAQNLPTTIDFVFLDGAKPLYSKILSLVEPYLRLGAMIVADNADHGDYLNNMRSSNKYISIPFGKDVELSMKIV
jgi:predicted O-methyltransferase YrrM